MLSPKRVLSLALLLAAGCRTVAPALAVPTAMQVTVRAPGVEFELTGARADSGELGRLGSGLLEAIGLVRRWGSLRGVVQVRVLESHAALEDLFDRHDHVWLRAWSNGGAIFVQSPRTWDESEKQARSMVPQLLTHELTHVLMYQQLEPDGDPPWWLTGLQPEEPPLWFVEGMASVTASQKRMLPSELQGWLSAHPGVNPLEPDAELVRTEKEAVYGAAHRAFERLLEQGGDQPVRDVLRGMRAGARFGDAFAAATGRQVATFEREALTAGFATRAEPKLPARGAGGP